MLTHLLFFKLGVVFLVGGAALLVRGASRLALSVGVSPLVVGLTVVAFGTSAPEMAVSVQSAQAGQTDIANFREWKDLRRVAKHPRARY